MAQTIKDLDLNMENYEKDGNISTIRIEPGVVVPAPPGAPATFMPTMPTIPGVPVGLEYLTQIDRLVIIQKASILEAVAGWEVKNKYAIFNSAGQQVYYAYEESGCCARQCCGGQRGFTIHIVDNFNKEVMRIQRPFKCCTFSCCASIRACGSEVTVEAPVGQVIGVVREKFGCCSYNMAVLNEDESQEIIRIKGPNMCGFNWCCRCCADKIFDLESPVDGQLVGSIRKKWTGAVKEWLTDADNFIAEFPLNLDAKAKATLLGATFLIDFLAFENNQGSNNN